MFEEIALACILADRRVVSRAPRADDLVLSAGDVDQTAASEIERTVESRKISWVHRYHRDAAEGQVRLVDAAGKLNGLFAGCAPDQRLADEKPAGILRDVHLEMLAVGEVHRLERLAAGREIAMLVNDADVGINPVDDRPVFGQPAQIDLVSVLPVLVDDELQGLVGLPEGAYGVLLEHAREVGGVFHDVPDFRLVLGVQLDDHRAPQQAEQKDAEGDEGQCGAVPRRARGAGGQGSGGRRDAR